MASVLLIDDDRSVCEMVNHGLQKAELRMISALTAADGLKRLEAASPEVVLPDEIGDICPLVQSNVLRRVQQQEFERLGGNETTRTDVRMITATNLDLDQSVKDGELREDLLYRLNGLTVNLPPLRKRGDDIANLLKHSLNVWAKKMMRRMDCETFNSLPRRLAMEFLPSATAPLRASTTDAGSPPGT